MYVFSSFARGKRRVAHRASGVVVLGVICLLLAGCTAPWQHNALASSGLGPKPTAQQVLSAAQKNFRLVTSFHVTMKTDNLGSSSASSSQFEIRDADGDVQMPDKVRAQADVLFSGEPVTVNLISVGTQQFITDPITGQWRVVKDVFNVSSLTNPKTGIISLTGKLRKVSGPVAEVVNGTPCWLVSGLLPAKDLAFFTGGGVPGGTMLKTSVCAGQADGLPYEVSVIGEAAVGDTSQTTRTFFISKYNESISIVVPQV